MVVAAGGEGTDRSRVRVCVCVCVCACVRTHTFRAHRPRPAPDRRPEIPAASAGDWGWRAGSGRVCGTRRGPAAPTGGVEKRGRDPRPPFCPPPCVPRIRGGE